MRLGLSAESPQKFTSTVLAFRSSIEILGSFYFVNIILPVNNVLIHNTKYGQAQEFMVHVFADGIYVLCMVHNGLLMAVRGGTTTRGHDLNHLGSGSHLVSNGNSSMKVCEGFQRSGYIPPVLRRRNDLPLLKPLTYDQLRYQNLAISFSATQRSTTRHWL
jgi:hypothetical protein